MRVVSLALLLLVLLPAACQRPNAEQCERLCWRFNELHFWEAFEKEAESLTPAAREALRAERQEAWDEMKTREFDPGLENCVRDCRKAGKPDEVDCVERAESSAAAKKCLE
jgi:hypothetical protein